jgi:hypothetical protein
VRTTRTAWATNTASNAGANEVSRSRRRIVGALSVELTQEEVAYLEEPYVPHPIVGHQCGR